MTKNTSDFILSMLPGRAVSGMVDVDRFMERVEEYLGRTDDELVHLADVCLRNLDRLEHVHTRLVSDYADLYLRAVVAPELCERLAPGCRTRLRRVTTSVAEWSVESSKFWRLTPRDCALREHRTDDAVAAIARLSSLGVESLVEQARFAISGSRVLDRWAADCPVYDAGFTYSVVPVLSFRVLERSRGAARV